MCRQLVPVIAYRRTVGIPTAVTTRQVADRRTPGQGAPQQLAGKSPAVGEGPPERERATEWGRRPVPLALRTSGDLKTPKSRQHLQFTLPFYCTRTQSGCSWAQWSL
eukprot:6233799-Prymnesium_polylepis.1